MEAIPGCKMEDITLLRGSWDPLGYHLLIDIKVHEHFDNRVDCGHTRKVSHHPGDRKVARVTWLLLCSHSCSIFPPIPHQLMSFEKNLENLTPEKKKKWQVTTDNNKPIWFFFFLNKRIMMFSTWKMDVDFWARRAIRKDCRFRLGKSPTTRLQFRA